MNLRTEKSNPEDYLASSPAVDARDPLITKKARELFAGVTDENEKIRIAFEFVRDKIAHSWDIRSRRVTRNAHEVLVYGEGICYAKSMLLAALLRSQGIPTGFCYQKLTLGDTVESGYCLHALNAVYLSSPGRWHRIDARGNTGGKNAQFNPDKEQLAFPVRQECGEIDYPVIFAEPLPITIETLENNSDCIDMILHHLPTELGEKLIPEVTLVRALPSEAELLARIQSQSFYDDFVDFGECPAYEEGPRALRELIDTAIAYKIMADSEVAGSIIVRARPKGEYYLRVLAILPGYQNLHIGGRAVKLLFEKYPDAEKWTLVTPQSRERNCHFYEKLGFVKVSEEFHSPVLTLNHYEKKMK